MYIYTKENGLELGKSKRGIQIDIMSDLHLDFYMDFNHDLSFNIQKFIQNARDNLDSKNDEVLIVAGDISHFNKASKELLTQVAKIWDNVLVIPGNHDWYLQNKGEDRYNDLINSLMNVENITFLMDKVDIFEHKGIKFGGATMIYNLDRISDYAMWKSIMSDHRFMSREFVQSRNKKDIDYYKNVINEVDVFVSHVPIVNLDGRSATENLFLNVDVTPISDVLYISGHTHRPKSSVNVSSEFDAVNIGYGYPSESKNQSVITTIMYKN